jgi:glycosyltransferase involved in cell wall biosynthesis
VKTSARPLVSIIVPTRNEAADIAPTLEACLAVAYEPKEIIVVDDSTDNTPHIVRGYAERGVSLIHRERNENGCCGARNLGMQQAKGEILVVMNADDRPTPDFLDRLLAHYQDGADYVIVKSVVQNLDNIWARYVWAGALKYFSTDPDMEWSEGFSCRKAAAEQVGYIPGDFPVPFCRDYLIGVALGRAGYRKHTALDIPMEHVAPGDLKTFWNNRVWRGTFSAPYNYYFHKKTLPALFLREVLKLGWRVLRYVLIFPILWETLTLTKYTRRSDFPAFLWVGLVLDVATTVGGFKGFSSLATISRSIGKDRK